MLCMWKDAGLKTDILYGGQFKTVEPADTPECCDPKNPQKTWIDILLSYDIKIRFRKVIGDKDGHSVLIKDM